MLRRLLRQHTSVTDPHDIEKSIRQEVRELEQEATAFHEAIGLLRAGLSLSSEGESFWREKLHQYEEEDLKHKQLVTEGWRRERLHNHTLRNLYHQLLEAKRRFLYHWHDTLQQQVRQLPAERQKPLQALLNNTLQGLLSMGIEQIEANHRQELEQFLNVPPTTTFSPSLDALAQPSKTHDAI